MNMNALGILSLFVLFSLMGSALAENYVVVNSANGIDVISGVSYANAKNVGFRYLTSQATINNVVLDVGSGKDILLIQSNTVPIATGLADTLRQRGNDVEVIETTDDILAINLELAKRSGVKKFIVVDTTYGYNAVSVLPYASMTDAAVIMADKDTANQVAQFLNSLNGVESLLIYGFVDTEVKNALAEFSPDVIDNGDKYTDNIEIVKLGLDVSNVDQVIMTDGSFIEISIAEGKNPVLFIAMVVPDQVYNYLKTGDVKGAIVVGNHLIQAAQQLRQDLADDGKEITVMSKFGRSNPFNPGVVESLDIFALPAYPLDMSVQSATYNEMTKKLEIVYKNNVEAVAYFKSNIEILVDGSQFRVLGDETPVFIEKNEAKGVEYNLDLSELGDVRSANVAARVATQYGSTTTLLEALTGGEFTIATISKEDLSRIDINGLSYDKNSRQLVLDVENTGNVRVYYKPEFSLEVENSERVFKKDIVESLNSGQSTGLVFSNVELSDNAVESNKQVSVHVSYGDRDAFLTKSMDKTVSLGVISSSDGSGAVIIVIVVVVVIVIAVFALRMRAVAMNGGKKRKKKKGL